MPNHVNGTRGTLPAPVVRSLVNEVRGLEQKAMAIRLVLFELNGYKIPGHPANGIATKALGIAFALDASRRHGSPGPRPTRKYVKRRGHGKKSAVADRRRGTLAFLARFDAEEPRHPPKGSPARGIGTLLRHGYLRKKGEPGQYIRTAKEFSA